MRERVMKQFVALRSNSTQEFNVLRSFSSGFTNWNLMKMVLLFTFNDEENFMQRKDFRTNGFFPFSLTKTFFT